MYLFLNTQNSDQIILALINKSGQILVMKKISAEHQQSEKLLASLESILKQAKINLKKITGLIVVTGPGSFTALRIGLATANILAWSLQIPIIGLKSTNQSPEQLIKVGLKKITKIKKFQQVLPEYGQEPNITVAKK